jgi:small subunit ribosomal protein S9
MLVSAQIAKKTEFFGKGRKKSSFACAILSKKFSNDIAIKKQSSDEYIGFFENIDTFYNGKQIAKRLNECFNLLGEELSSFSIRVIYRSGGLSSQSKCIEFAIAQALKSYLMHFLPEETFKIKKNILRSFDYITFNPRIKERKKPGRYKARKAYPYVKR